MSHTAASHGDDMAVQAGRILIADWIREGRTNTEIAHMLRMTRWRIDGHINAIRAELRDMGDRNRGQHQSKRGRQSQLLETRKEAA